MREHTALGPEFYFVFPTVTATHPVIPPNPHVTLHVAGEYTCGRIGQINQRRTGNLFEIQITKDPLQPGEVCDQVTRAFRRVIQLDVSRLEAGEYRYSINSGGVIINNSARFGEIGSFILPYDTFPNDECGGSSEDPVNSCIIFF
ncbi:MAG: hypothetical protein H6936_12605 [Burkholderiales bacterium]|nr:hypothetical protein [Nitrosomonas sp.]MCP5275662.1 hypothetical protein [Burkholderiales bacterium]